MYTHNMSYVKYSQRYSMPVQYLHPNFIQQYSQGVFSIFDHARLFYKSRTLRRQKILHPHYKQYMYSIFLICPPIHLYRSGRSVYWNQRGQPGTQYNSAGNMNHGKSYMSHIWSWPCTVSQHKPTVFKRFWTLPRYFCTSMPSVPSTL